MAGTALALGCAPAAHAQDPTLYCQGDGGPLGAATDAEHTVLLPEAPLPAGVTSSRVTVDGVSTRVQQAGPPDAQDAVVFVHGSPDNSRDWDDLVAAGGRFARTVAFDVSGYGKSDKNAPQIQSTDGVAKYLQGVLDQLGIRRAVLVGHDFGGIWGLQWATQHPDEFLGTVLIDSGTLIDYTPHPLAIVFATPIAGESYMASTTRDTFRAGVQQGNPHGLPPDYVDRLYDDYDRAARCAILRYYRSAAQNLNTGKEQADKLRPLDRPALVVWGKQDQYIPVDQAEKQKQAFPHAQVHVIDDSGHWPHIDNADRVRGLVVPFLEPGLSAARPKARAGQTRLKVPVAVTGILPAEHVQAKLGSAGASTPAAVTGRRTLTIKLRRGLRPGRHVLSVSALGLPTRRIVLRVARPAAARAPSSSAPDPCERVILTARC